MVSWRDECLKIGLSTDKMDAQASVEVLTDFYRRIGKPTPKFFLCQSPFQAQLEINILRSGKLANLVANLQDNLGDNL